MMYNVFISSKSEDYPLAEELYKFLIENGLSVFLASKELQRIGEAQYALAIDEALDHSLHMIVLATRLEFINSKWVQYEWSTFSNDLKSGYRKGNLLTVISDSIEMRRLPPSLRHLQSFRINSYKAELLNYVNISSEGDWGTTQSPVGAADTYFLLGNEYYYGMDGKKTDYEEAVHWYLKAAEKGHIGAMFSLGNCYSFGKGVQNNFKKAKILYEQAAQLGHAEAQFCLGRCYKKGLGTQQDTTKAFAWFLKASEQGYVLAQNNLGICYEQGIGVPVNIEEAVKWYQLANKQGDVFAHDALVRLGKLPK